MGKISWRGRGVRLASRWTDPQCTYTKIFNNIPISLSKQFPDEAGEDAAWVDVEEGQQQAGEGVLKRKLLPSALAYNHKRIVSFLAEKSQCLIVVRGRTNEAAWKIDQPDLVYKSL